MKARLVYVHLAGIIAELIMQRLKLDTNWLLMDSDFIPKILEENNSRFSSSFLHKTTRISTLRIINSCWILLTALLLKVENIPLLALNIILEKLVHGCTQGCLRSNRLIQFIVTYITFAMSAFFTQGNSNLISTIDVSSGYIGLESYNLFLVSFQVISSTYALFIFWMLMLFIRIDESKFTTLPHLKLKQLMSCINFMLILRIVTVTFFMIISFILQNHLFIWSVISPKLLYEYFLTLLFYVLCLISMMAHKVDH